MARREFSDVAEKRRRRNSAPVGEHLTQGFDIEFSGDPWIREDRLDFGAEDKRLVGLCIEQWPYAKSIARQEQPATPVVPDSESPLSIQVLDAVFSFFL